VDPVPELPEVETVVRDLRPHLTGRRLAAVRASRKALRRPWQAVWNDAVRGRRVQTVRRRGKWIVVDLDQGHHLVFHLGMSGQLTVVEADTAEGTHTHLVFDLDRGKMQLRFRDPRRFGSAVYCDGGELSAFFDRTDLGPEPFDLKPTDWRRRLSATERCLKAVLLDQRVVAGVGNIYADEALYEARLHPARRADSLGAAEATRLRKAVAAVLTRAIEHRGSSVRNFVGGCGVQGEYQREHQVYGRTGDPCPRCGAPIERLRLAGRSSHYCPQCQRDATGERGAATP
jgi:formamidopyrimidine-DNA glycosylase